MSLSKIEWTDRSDWNPIRGCTRVSPGCGGPGPHGGCYAEAMAARFSDPGQWGHGFATRTPAGGRWTGKVELQLDRVTLPLRWAKGIPGRNKCFITSTSDPFHESLSDPEIDLIFAVMALRQDWIFQVLTKRSQRMREYLTDPRRGERAFFATPELMKAIGVTRDQAHTAFARLYAGPLKNVWLGVSVEDQTRADERIPDLLAAPAAIRWISAEPLLGPIALHRIPHPIHEAMFIDALDGHTWGYDSGPFEHRAPLDWVVTGGESGPRHRDNQFEACARSLHDQCASAGVAFFGKQNVGKRPLPEDLMVREFPPCPPERIAA